MNQNKGNQAQSVTDATSLKNVLLGSQDLQTLGLNGIEIKSKGTSASEGTMVISFKDGTTVQYGFDFRRASLEHFKDVGITGLTAEHSAHDGGNFRNFRRPTYLRVDEIPKVIVSDTKNHLRTERSGRIC